ncbi:NAD(P)-binding domain-containing protein [Pukyongiella litopenaei]|uniref:NAD(P)/FAD-dependent oxidoreductase n=1 Tax=Pukyongiella litopenaei TaxID=2605946 RepID=A0A2S0MUC1_9RHOB|nr:NAD(P)/FAD-dependent oxidoreductase [Pukyongiella litopenaei]AVO39397.1 NAD(P)/FAD-dependent oxidoreductase [Pukyongiella litopenaei]
MPDETSAMPIDGAGLPALEARLREDLDYLCWPGKPWVPERRKGDEPVADVVIVGGGMCGLVTWLALRTAGIERIRVIDRSPEGREGPWVTYARMRTLRSPKQLTGPAYGHGALTFQAWFRAQFGTAAWEELDKIPRPMWMDYLRWYRKALGVPVENGVSLDRVDPEGDLLRLHLSGAPEASVLTRKLIMATGRDGTGVPNIPGFMDGVSRRFWAHSSDDIDFDALRGRRVAVVGVGASAVDNAAEALERGAAEVRHLIRRAEMPTINKMMGIGSFGFVAGYCDLSDEWRWRFMNYSFVTQTPSPRGSTLRVSQHDNAHFHFDCPVTRVEESGDGLRLSLGKDKVLDTDFLILGTGFATDPMARTEFGAAAGDIALWQDVYAPPEGEENRELALFPYLNGDFSFREKVPGTAPWLENVYCFNFGATASLGKVSGDIPGVSDGAQWLATALSAKLYEEDIAAHWQGLQDYATPELLGDEWTASAVPEPVAAAAGKGAVA